MTTLRQIQANQRNAQSSTGPRTQEGKDASRRNALMHGLAGAGIVLPHEEERAIEERLAQWHSSLRPFDNVDEWLARQVVVASVQVDRCQQQEHVVRAAMAHRAEVRWEDDRRLAAEVLAGGLARKPSKVSRQLQQTPQGCDWLIERWDGLAKVVEHRGDWSESQRALALDMLGTPAELRVGPTPIDPAPGLDAIAHRAAIASGEAARLRHLKESSLADIDEHERAAAELGLEVETPRPLSLLRRYEAACQRKMQWALKQLRGGRRPASPSPSSPAPFDARLVDEPDGEDDADLDEPESTMDEEMAALERYLSLADLDAPMATPTPTAEPSPPPFPAPIAPPAPTPAGGNRRARRAARRRQARRS